MPEITRNQGPAEPAKGLTLETPAAAPPGAEKLAASAVATLDMEAAPQARVPEEVPDLGAEAPSNEGPSDAGPTQETPAPAKAEGPEPSPRSVSELAQDPAAKAALQAALDNKTIKFESLRAVVQTGLETGEFNFKSPGQERVVKEIIAGSIKPVPSAAGPEAPAKGPEGTGPAPAPGEAPAKASALEKAITNFPGLDARVKDALLESPEASAAKNPPFTKGDLLTAKPSVGDAVRYANAMALKTENFEPKNITADFQAALGRTNKGSLYDLANDQGIKLYPKAAPSGSPREGGSGRDANTLVAPDSKYGRAIAAAQEKGVELPAPADPKGYTVGEARQMNTDKLLDLDAVAVARQTPAPAQAKELAGPEDRKQVLDAISQGVDGKAGLPKDTFMSLSNPAKNEVRNIVKGLGAPNADISSMVVTALLAKEFKDRLEKESSKPSE